MKTQGLLMQACFVEIHQVPAKIIRSDIFLTEWYMYEVSY